MADPILSPEQSAAIDAVLTAAASVGPTSAAHCGALLATVRVLRLAFGRVTPIVDAAFPGEVR